MAILCFAQNAPNVPNGQADHPNGAGENKAVTPVTVINNCSPGEQAHQKSDGCPNGSTSVWGNIPDWVLAIVGVFTLFAIIKQAIETRKAAQAAQESAETMKGQTDVFKDSVAATRRNINVLIASERAWVLVDRIQQPYLTPYENLPNSQQRLGHCIFFLKNFGRHPATIVASHFEMHLTDRPVGPRNASFYDMPPRTVNQSPYVIPPGAEPVPHEAELIEGFVTASMRDEILVSKNKFLWLCGILRYFDFDPNETEERETRFCFMYETRLNGGEPFWRPDGSPGLNQAK